MSPWPTGVPKGPKVREWEHIDSRGFRDDWGPISPQRAMIVADAALTECAEVIERLQVMAVCDHLSATGVDQAPNGPDKLWRCDGCGFTYRNVPDGKGGFGWYTRVPVWDAEDGGA